MVNGRVNPAALSGRHALAGVSRLTVHKRRAQNGSESHGSKSQRVRKLFQPCWPALSDREDVWHSGQKVRQLSLLIEPLGSGCRTAEKENYAKGKDISCSSYSKAPLPAAITVPSASTTQMETSFCDTSRPTGRSYRIAYAPGERPSQLRDVRSFVPDAHENRVLRPAALVKLIADAV